MKRDATSRRFHVPTCLRAAPLLIGILFALGSALPARPQPPLEPPSPPIFQVGQAVDVFVRDGKWYPARIVEITVDGRPRVRYDGFGEESDEVVDPRTLRPRAEPPPPAKEPQTTFTSGQKVEVFAKGKWFKATVTQALQSRVEVRYDGYDYSEWIQVDPRWIRPDPAAVGSQSSSIPPQSLPPAPAEGEVPVAPSIPAPTPSPSPRPTIGSAISSPTSQLPPDGLFVMERNLAGVVERRAVLIDKTGNVFENPVGGMEPFDVEMFRASNPSGVGKARVGRGEMEILWEGGRLPAAGQFEISPEGFLWDMATFYRVAPPTPSEITGSFQAGSTEPVRTRDGWTMGSSGMRLDLKPDGTYRRTNADGILMGEGSYTLTGFTLTLENSGVKTRHCVFRFVSGGGTEPLLYFDGQFLRAIP